MKRIIFLVGWEDSPSQITVHQQHPFIHLQVKRESEAKFLFWVYSAQEGSNSYFQMWQRRLVSSVGRVLVCWLVGHEVQKARREQQSGSLNNWEESAVFVMTSTDAYTSKSSPIRTKNCRSYLTAISLIWFLWEVKEPTSLFEKSGEQRRRWCGQPFLGWVGYFKEIS